MACVKCVLPSGIFKYTKFFNERNINFCISGGYALYKGGFSCMYSDIDIFFDGTGFDSNQLFELDELVQLKSNSSYTNSVIKKETIRQSASLAGSIRLSI